MNIKCNFCGGNVAVSADKTFATCEYCGATVTVPRVSDEQRAAAFNRGSHFRRIGEFDKALASYERILWEDDTDAEAHWCAALCRFGVEYVENTATFEWLPTCHRASFDSFLEDVDYKAALEHSDGLTRRLYQKEAAKIAEVQRGILATSQNEEPYDVFLCYKDKDEDGNRTQDSILAQDIYYQLTDQGHRVFFSRITMEDKCGSQYEPYIFAALNSAKVMVVLGMKPEHFSAVWVKNEWSRFLALMRRDHSRVLLPCYRDMDPYNLPEQLKVLQSYDMGKIGFIQDLIRGVDKVVKAGKTEAAPVVIQQVQEVAQFTGSNVDALVERGFMALEDQEWQKADQFFEDALNQNARLARAYLGKFFASNHASSMDDFGTKYLARTDKAVPASKEACPIDVELENKAIQQYTIPGFMEAPAIRAAFAFNRTYESTSESRKKQLDDVRQLWRSDKNLTRAAQFGDANLKAQMEECQNSILRVLTARLDDALAKDSAAIAKIKRDYENHKQNALSVVQQNSSKAKAANFQQKYAQAIQLLNQPTEAGLLERLYGVTSDGVKASSELKESDYLRAAEIMESISGYLDADKHAAKYRAMAENVRKEQIYRQATQCSFFLPSEDDLSKAVSLFKSISGYKDSTERMKECEKRLTEKQTESRKSSYRERALCQYCGGSFKGFLKPRCSVCGKEKDY